MQDNHLIKAIKENQRWAQLAIYHKYKNSMLKLVWRILRDEFKAKDVVHDAFIKAFGAVHKLNESANLGAWLKRIAINTALDLWKQQQRMDYGNTEELAVEAEEMDFPKHIPVGIILKELTALPEKYRVVLELYLLDEYSHKEIATMLGLNYSTVRNRYVRGKEILATRLKQSKYGEER